MERAGFLIGLKPLLIGASVTLALAEFNFEPVALITGVTTGFYTIAKAIDVLVDSWIKYQKNKSVK